MFDLSLLNPSVSLWLDEMSYYMRDLKNSENADVKDEDFELWDRLEGRYPLETKGGGDGYNELLYVDYSYSTDVWGPYIQTKWDQGDPWNQYVPLDASNLNRCPAGCVLIAGAQVLYFLEHKLDIFGGFYTTTTATGNINNYLLTLSDFSAGAFNNMALTSSSTTSAKSLSASLIACMGSYVNRPFFLYFSGYGSNGTGSLLCRLKEYYENKILDNSPFANTIDCILENYDPNIVKNNIISKGLPVLISAGDDSTYFSGHAWVIDGYKKTTAEYVFYYRWVDGDPSNNPNYPGDTGELWYPCTEVPSEYDFIQVSTDVLSEYFTMNWGWGGIGDNADYALTGTWSAGGYSFYNNKRMLHSFVKK